MPLTKISGIMIFILIQYYKNRTEFNWHENGYTYIETLFITLNL